MTHQQSPQDDPPPFGRALVSTNQRTSWHSRDRPRDAAFVNGVEAWVYAMRGEFRGVHQLTRATFREFDLVMVNLDFMCIDQLDRVVPPKSERSATVVALFEGELAWLRTYWPEWRRVADRCDLVIAINRYGVSTLEELTSTPVSYIGIPYPVDGVRGYSVPIEQRTREILLCAHLLERTPLDYLAAHTLGIPMYGHVNSFKRTIPNMLRHRSLDGRMYIKRARGLYNDAALTVAPQVSLNDFLARGARSLLWMNLETRYTWGRYVIDAAALGIPIVTTRETGHGPVLFPDLTVDSPYDVAAARVLAARLLEDDAFYRSTIEHAWNNIDWYRPERAVERLTAALASI